MQEYIYSPTLISAYDIYFDLVESDKQFPSFNSVPLLIIDSGGYEANCEPEFSETPSQHHRPNPWTIEHLHEALSKFESAAPKALVTYDHPALRTSMEIQIARALEFKDRYPDDSIIFLMKPERAGQTQLDIDSIKGHAKSIAVFDAIGVTEDEAGRSLTDRMVFIAKLRQCLDDIGGDAPIHVFGSLDTLLTQAYFLAGADIFDGLTWLRHYYHMDSTVYRRHHPIIENRFEEPADRAESKMHVHNYNRLQEIQSKMRAAIASQSVAGLPHSELIMKAYDSMQARLGI